MQTTIDAIRTRITGCFRKNANVRIGIEKAVRKIYGRNEAAAALAARIYADVKATPRMWMTADGIDEIITAAITA